MEEAGADRPAGAAVRGDAASTRFSDGRSADTGPAPTGPAFAQADAGDDPEEYPEGRGRRGGGRRQGGRRQGGRAGGESGQAAGGPGRGARSEEPADPAARARDICLRLLTGTAKTRKQLADALRKREIPDEVAEEVLDRLEEVGLIDDAAFADAWVESRHAGRGLARRALAQELRTRGVAGELVEQAVAQLGADEEAEAARALVERKLRSTRGLERQARTRRLVGMLARRGYSEGLAYRVVREALGEEDEEPGDNDW
ncbi:recombination regulator RecX [Kitasatospora sp. NPDC057015]|uniref:recombination regulator RecX n=1 Tax=Kitasatospora sp. NPDC057015 TaxID=3346001 RepID=UPI00363571D8